MTKERENLRMQAKRASQVFEIFYDKMADPEYEPLNDLVSLTDSLDPCFDAMDSYLDAYSI